MNYDYLSDLVMGDMFRKVELHNVEVIYPSDALDNGLSHSRMMRMLTLNHPGKVNPEGKLDPYPIWGTRTGFHCCGKQRRQSDLQSLGVGIALYYKLVKYLTVLFGLCTVLSIPACSYFFAGKNSHH
mmetsp:Transcript_7230/g.6341  ORF Transcript_7230/g.6341 Transcript_7230/m.6341 type:complete len:127 (+) Transcript_7230:733-1113(+)